MRRTASRRESSPSKLMAANIDTATTLKGKSPYRVLRSISIGVVSEAKPTMRRALKMLLPTTLPMAMSALPSRALTKLTKNSGIEVPKPTIVSPMTISGTR